MDIIFPMQWGPHDGQCVKAPMDKSDITFMIILSFKTQLGFTGRDYMYYKKRHGRDVAYLKPLEYTKDVEMMLEANEHEKEVRLVLSKEAEVHEMVTITPQKRRRHEPSRQHDDREEQLDQYKIWLANLEEQQEEIGTLSCWFNVQSISQYVECSIELTNSSTRKV
jgi:hypothetical protein